MLRGCTQESKETIILGDFNVNYLKKNEHKGIKAIFQLYGFNQIIKKATCTTRESSTLIDLIPTNNMSAISKHVVYPTSLSDHDMVDCVRKLNYAKYSPRIVTCHNYSLYDPSAMLDDFTKVNWQPIMIQEM